MKPSHKIFLLFVSLVLTCGASGQEKKIKRSGPASSRCATPACWEIEYLRQRGGYLEIELSDFAYAIELGDAM